MVVVILLAIVVLCFYLAVKLMKSKNKWKAELQKEYGDLQGMLRMGALVSGHPNINDRVPKCGGFVKDKEIHLFQYFDDKLNVKPVKIATISGDKITNVLVEDQSTIERRISATRMVLVGVFALAWKKKTKNELSYLTVFWNDGRFDHETVFEFESKDSLSRANAVRNAIISKI